MALLWAFPTPQHTRMPNLVTHLKRTLMFKWCKIRCGFKNGQHIAVCLKEIGLQACNLLFIFRFNNQHSWGGIEDLCDHVAKE